MQLRAFVLGCALSSALAGYSQALPASGLRPFSAVAVAFKVGAEGIGFDAATPLAAKLNLRGGASFLNYSHLLNEDGIQVDPTFRFRKVGFGVDYYPWGGSFRLSPGVVVHNGNRVDATAMVPAGQSIDLNDTLYYSSPNDPLHGVAAVRFGSKVAPSFTVGWGNMLPHSGRRVSIPFEVGFQYIGRPTVKYDFAGSACNSEGCAPVQDDLSFQANKIAQQSNFTNDLAPLRFYPILSVGLGFKF